MSQLRGAKEELPAQRAVCYGGLVGARCEEYGSTGHAHPWAALLLWDTGSGRQSGHGEVAGCLQKSKVKQAYTVS